MPPVRTDPLGRRGPTPKAARGPSWRRTTRGFYVPSSVLADDVEQRIVEAAAVLRAGEAVTGWAALAWRGARWFNGLDRDGEPLDVPLSVSRHAARQPGLLISQEHVKPSHLDVVDGLPVTTAVHAVCWAARYAPTVVEARTVLEMAAYDDLVSLQEVADHARQLTAWTGVEQLRAALIGASENVWSPQETRARHVWQRVKPVLLLCNVPVFDLDGRHLATPDLLDPAAGVAGQYDGEVHLLPEQRARDERREDVVRGADLASVTMTRADGADGYRDFERRLLDAYARAALVAHLPRRWTLRQPAWWVDTSTVARRRALDGDQRDRWLRYRRAS